MPANSSASTKQRPVPRQESPRAQEPVEPLTALSASSSTSSPPAAKRGRPSNRTMARLLASECQRHGVGLACEAPSLRAKLEVLAIAQSEKKEAKRARKRAKKEAAAEETKETEAVLSTTVEVQSERNSPVELAGENDDDAVAVQRSVFLPVEGSPHRQTAQGLVYELTNGCYGVHFSDDASCLQVLRVQRQQVGTSGAEEREYILYVNPQRHSLIFPTTSARPPVKNIIDTTLSTASQKVETKDGSENKRLEPMAGKRAAHHDDTVVIVPLALADKMRSLLWARKWWAASSSGSATDPLHKDTKQDDDDNKKSGDGREDPLVAHTNIDPVRWTTAHAAVAAFSSSACDALATPVLRRERFGFCVGIPEATATVAEAPAAARPAEREEWHIPFVSSVGEAANGVVSVSLANQLTPYPDNLFYGS